MQLRKITAALSTAALVSGAGLGVAQAQSSDTNTDRAPKQAHRGPGGPDAAQLKTLADKLGVTTAKLKAAFAAVRPAPPAAGSKPREGDHAADLAKALGVETSAVQKILDANRPAKPNGARPAPGSAPAPGTARPKPDQSKLIAALATGLKLDQATVQAAFDKLEASHRADHDARDTAMAAALAKQLGLEADAVEAALDATRPPKPAGRS
jgi:hypothetical protein